MERLNYSPDEIRDAFRYWREQGGHLARSHAANWRRTFTQFIDAVRLNQEALKLVARLLDGHQTASASKWCKAASDRRTPPMPADRYEKLALVWKLICMAVQKVNPDGFDAREKIDLPYVLTNSDLPGGSLAERFEEFRVRYILPFIEEIEAFTVAVERALPASGQVDLWDAALAGFAAKPAPAARGEPEAAPEPEPEEEADEAEAGGDEEAGAPRAKRKPAAKKAGAKKTAKKKTS